MTVKQATALGGFLLLGLSPSFVDWQEAPDKRTQIVLFYLVAMLMVYYGVFS